MYEKFKTSIQDFIDFITFNPFNLRYFWERVTGTIAYARFIWKYKCYREWDFEYLYDLMAFKLERMKKQLAKDSFVADHSERVKEIDEVLATLNTYQHVVDNIQNHDNIDEINKAYELEQQAWEKFHDLLKEHAQKWWS